MPSLPARTRTIPNRAAVLRQPPRRTPALGKLGLLMLATACFIAAGIAMAVVAVLVLTGGLLH
jgi:hypothetical protein